MELSLCLNYLRKRRGSASLRSMEETAKLAADAGFMLADYTPDFEAENWREMAAHDFETLSKYGIRVEQTHAPFNRYRTYDQADFKKLYRNEFEASKIVGAKYVVVHADEYRTGDRYDEKEIEDFAYEFLSPYVDYAAANGLTVAIENVFEDDAKWPKIDGKSRYTSRVYELKGIIDRFNAPEVKCCWDFGHAKCAFGRDGMLGAFKTVSDKVVCTHVHDNYYGKDLHLMPFLGEIDWEAHMKYLAEIGYSGAFSLEYVYDRFPDELVPLWLNTSREVAGYLTKMFDSFKK